MIILVCIKQHLTNVWSLILEKVKQHWGCIEKKYSLQKKRVFYHDNFKAVSGR